MRAGELFKPAPNTQVRTVRKRRTERKCDGGRASGPGSKSVHRKRSLGGMSRADVRWGPRFSSTAPGRHPPLLLHQISPVGWPLCGGNAEPRCDACGRTFQIGPQHAGADGEEAADGRKCDGGRASGPGSESVHRTRSLGGMSRADVRWGPRFSSTAPAGPPSPPPSDFPVGWPLCGGECRAEVRCVRGNFSNRAQHAGADGEEAADGRKCDGGRASRPGSKSVHRKRSLGGMSRADVRWGPRFSSTAPGRHPHPLLHQISPWAGRSVETNAEPRCDGAGKLFKPGPTRKCGR